MLYDIKDKQTSVMGGTVLKTYKVSPKVHFEVWGLISYNPTSDKWGGGLALAYPLYETVETGIFIGLAGKFEYGTRNPNVGIILGIKF